MLNAKANGTTKFFRDPLGQFLLGGLAIFLLVAALSPQQKVSDNPNHIVIDRDTLLNQLQYRAKVFEPSMAERKLDSMSEQELENLISQYVEEEALFREATALGFGDNDYIIKKRMIQKMDFIIDGVSASTAQATETDIQAYYDENASNFVEPGYVTFTHVFINGEDRSSDEVKALAKTTLNQLRADKAGFIAAPKYGDRFPFGLNYVEKTHDLISSHFGTDMAKTLFQLTPDAENWQGPFRSDYGLHMIMMTKRTEDRQQPLAEITDQVVREVENEKRQEIRQTAIAKLVQSYSVVRRPLHRPTVSGEAEVVNSVINSAAIKSNEG